MMKKIFLIGVLLALIFVAVWAHASGGDMQISQEGIDFIKEQEGFEGRLYEDQGGNTTIGYGHLVHIGPIDGNEPQAYQDGIDEATGETILTSDLKTAVDAVNSDVSVILTQDQFDALVSFVFNIGVGAFKTSTALKEINAGNFAGVPAAMAMFNKSGGVVVDDLVNRRKDEGAAFA